MILKIILALVVLATAFPAGKILKKATKDEISIKKVKKWLKLINIFVLIISLAFLNLIFFKLISLGTGIVAILSLIYFYIITYISIT